VVACKLRLSRFLTVWWWVLALWLSAPGSERHRFAIVEIVVFIIYLSSLIFERVFRFHFTDRLFGLDPNAAGLLSGCAVT